MEHIPGAYCKLFGDFCYSSNCGECYEMEAHIEGEAKKVQFNPVGDHFEVRNEFFRFNLYVLQTGDQYLVSVPGFHWCGIVSGKTSWQEIRDNCGVDSKWDAATISEAVNYIIGHKLYPGQTVAEKEGKKRGNLRRLQTAPVLHRRRRFG